METLSNSVAEVIPGSSADQFSSSAPKWVHLDSAGLVLLKNVKFDPMTATNQKEATQELTEQNYLMDFDNDAEKYNIGMNYFDTKINKF